MDEAADRHGFAGHRDDGVAGNRDPAKLRTQADGIRNRVEPAREGRAIDGSPAERHGQRRKILGARRRIVPHHFSRETAGDDTMRNVKPSSQGQSQRVHGAARGVGKRHARQMRSDGHVIARRGVPRLAADHFQRAPDAPRRFQGQSTRQRRGHSGDESLNGMHQRVNARGRRDLGGQAIRKRLFEKS